MPPAPLPQQLVELSELLGQMCTAAAVRCNRATTALLESPGTAGRAGHRRATPTIDALRAQVEELAGDALLFHNPVAGDLRAVVSAIRAAGDIERMGDLALHVAEVVRMRHPDPALPAEVHADFAEMGRVAVQLALQGGRGRALPQRAHGRRAGRRRRRDGRAAPRRCSRC